ncbi:MAG: SUMF1/EgtB/PvdO family nonheme iron enzyme [Planctomycetota bacterium]
MTGNSPETSGAAQSSRQPTSSGMPSRSQPVADATIEKRHKRNLPAGLAMLSVLAALLAVGAWLAVGHLADSAQRVKDRTTPSDERVIVLAEVPADATAPAGTRVVIGSGEMKLIGTVEAVEPAATGSPDRIDIRLRMFAEAPATIDSDTPADVITGSSGMLQMLTAWFTPQRIGELVKELEQETGEVQQGFAQIIARLRVLASKHFDPAIADELFEDPVVRRELMGGFRRSLLRGWNGDRLFSLVADHPEVQQMLGTMQNDVVLRQGMQRVGTGMLDRVLTTAEERFAAPHAANTANRQRQEVVGWIASAVKLLTGLGGNLGGVPAPVTSYAVKPAIDWGATQVGQAFFPTTETHELYREALQSAVRTELPAVVRNRLPTELAELSEWASRHRSELGDKAIKIVEDAIAGSDLAGGLTLWVTNVATNGSLIDYLRSKKFTNGARPADISERWNNLLADAMNDDGLAQALEVMASRLTTMMGRWSGRILLNPQGTGPSPILIATLRELLSGRQTQLVVLYPSAAATAPNTTRIDWIPVGLRARWNALPLTRRDALRKLPGTARELLLALPEFQRVRVENWPVERIVATGHLRVPQRGQLLAMSDMEREALFALPTDLLSTAIAVDTPARQVLLAMNASERAQLVRFGAQEREWMLVQPEPVRVAVIELVGRADAIKSTMSLPAALLEVLSELPDVRLRLLFLRTPEAVRERTRLMNAADRVRLIELSPLQQQVWLALDSGPLKGAYLSLEPEQRVRVDGLPIDLQATFLGIAQPLRLKALDRLNTPALFQMWFRLAPSVRGDALALPDQQLSYACSLPTAQLQEAFLHASEGERTRLAGLSPALLAQLLRMTSTETAMFWRLPVASRQEFASAPLPVRGAAASCDDVKDALALLSLEPRVRLVASLLADASERDSYIRAGRREQLAGVDASGLSPALWQRVLSDSVLAPDFILHHVELLNHRAVLIFRNARFAQSISVDAEQPSAPECEFVLVPGGEFTMGSPTDEVGRVANEEPQLKVTISPFLLARTEVTQGVWAGLTKGTDLPSAPSKTVQPKGPANQINWVEVDAWSRHVGLRLPSEAEWECACRAGTTSAYSFDAAELEAYANAGSGGIRPVAALRPNGFGLFDMHGNVWEWCADSLQPTLEGAPTDGKPWVVLPANKRVYRGGAFDHTVGFARSASRAGSTPLLRSDNLGFRPACSIAE